LVPLVGEVYAKEIISFFDEWKSLLDVDLGKGPESLHTALEGLIGPRAKQIGQKTCLRLYKKFGLVSPYL
jgi:hypothetical protein